MRHMILTCKNHPNLRWQCKSIAVNPDGSYNGARNIFYLGREDPSRQLGYACDLPECPCPASDLTFAPGRNGD